MTKLNELSATALLARYRDRTLSPVEVTQSVLDCIETWEPHIHATYALDREQALVMARASERRWADGTPLGSLDGVPVTIKENIATKGVPIPLGSAASELRPAMADAPPAARLREAGAVFVTKTTMPDYGMLAAALSSFHPLTRNPWDLTKNTGGSSSGAGAAAAAGYGPLHVGSDIGGSIRIPSSFCGIFGLKPSLGRVPIDPPFQGRVAGPMTRTVEDAALMMSVLSQPDMRDYMNLPPASLDWNTLDSQSLRGVRIGLWLDPGCGYSVDGEVEQAIRGAASAFERAGAHVEPLPNWLRPDMYEAAVTSFSMRMHLMLKDMPEARSERVLPILREASQDSRDISGATLYQAMLRIIEMRAATVAATHAFDYVLSPVAAHQPFAAEAPCFAPSQRKVFVDTLFTMPYNMSEQPAASINCGYTASGLPIGLQIAGRRFDDLGVLRMARHWESMRPAQRAWPVVPNVR